MCLHEERSTARAPAAPPFDRLRRDPPSPGMSGSTSRAGAPRPQRAAFGRARSVAKPILRRRGRSLPRREAELKRSDADRAVPPSRLAHRSMRTYVEHRILNHTSDDTDMSREGFLFRNRFDEEQEDEANWLAGCLLLPRRGVVARVLAPT